MLDFSRLYPAPPTPEDELCHCSGRPPIKLMWALAENPIRCVECNHMVPPETLQGWTQELIDGVAHWNSLYGSLYCLWLDSGEYEAWAAEKLAAIEGSVNKEGRDLVAELNRLQRCYYWWFEEHLENGAVVCPICTQPFSQARQRVCEECSVVLGLPGPWWESCSEGS